MAIYIYILITGFNDIDDDATRWLSIIYIYYTVMLRSTTGPYGRPVLEVAYGEFFIFHSIEAVWERIAREEWLGCQHVASPILGILGSTPVWAQLYYFIFWFL